jgi:glycine/D-amino acid oxidase-like deaminating enzyme
VEKAVDLVSKRIPVLRDAPYRSGRAGVLDMTSDGRPILGPEGPEGLYLAVGWSGTGFKKAPRWRPSLCVGSPRAPLAGKS